MCFKITNRHLFHKYKIRLTCQVVKFKNVELIVNMFVRFVQDAPDARQVAILAVLMVEMMELIQTAHQNGLRKVIPKTNGRGKPLSFLLFFHKFITLYFNIQIRCYQFKVISNSPDIFHKVYYVIVTKTSNPNVWNKTYTFTQKSCV